MNVLSAAEKVLRKVGKPLNAKEITELAIKDQLVSLSGRTPIATFAARIYSDIKRKGPKSKFRKIGNGRF